MICFYKGIYDKEYEMLAVRQKNSSTLRIIWLSYCFLQSLGHYSLEKCFLIIGKKMQKLKAYLEHFS